MNRKSFIFAVLLVTSMGFYHYSGKDGERFLDSINIAELPPSTKFIECEKVETHTSENVRVCLIETTVDDLPKLMAGHSYSDLNLEIPKHRHIATPHHFEHANLVDIIFNEATGKAAVTIKEP